MSPLTFTGGFLYCKVVQTRATVLQLTNDKCRNNKYWRTCTVRKQQFKSPRSQMTPRYLAFFKAHVCFFLIRPTPSYLPYNIWYDSDTFTGTKEPIFPSHKRTVGKLTLFICFHIQFSTLVKFELNKFHYIFSQPHPTTRYMSIIFAYYLLITLIFLSYFMNIIRS